MDILFNLIIDLFEGAVFAFFICRTAGKSLPAKKLIVPFIIAALSVFGLICAFDYLFSFEDLAIYAYGAALFIVSMIFLERNVLRNILLCLVPVNALAIGSIISTNVISFILKKPIMEFMINDPAASFITIIIGNLIIAAIVLIVQKIVRSNDSKFSTGEIFALLFAVAVSIVAFNFIYRAIFLSESITLNFYLTIAVICLVAINLAFYMLMIHIGKKNALERENTVIKMQYEGQVSLVNEVKSKYDEISRTRHDFKNSLGLIDELIRSGKESQARDYISEYIGTMTSDVLYVYTNNDFVNSIVSYEVMKAKERGIDVDVRTVNEIDFPDNTELCSLIANMFDNAIEAAAKCEGDKRISLEIERKDASLRVTMLNTVNEPVLASNPTLTSTKSDTAHGYGMKIIRDTAARYGGHEDHYDTEDRRFCCSVTLYPELQK